MTVAATRGDELPRVLVVDDQRHNRRLLEVILEGEGVAVEMAASGEEAVAVIARRPPDLILLDVMMPGISGYEVASAIKNDLATAHIPIIIVTALDDHDSMMHGLSSGAESFLTKPVDRAELCLRVKSLLRLKAHGDHYGRYSEQLETEVALRTAELALERNRQEQVRFKDEFLSLVSHELRSPLTATKQFTSILLGGLAGDLNAEQRQYLQIVMKNIHQLQSMIDDLLEVSRLEGGKLTIEPSAVSVPAAVGDAFETVEVTARAKGIALSSDLPADLPSGFADRIRLRQILIILLDNAVKFTPEGGAVSVRARAIDDQGFLQIDVSDTGCGVPAQIVDRIFDRLYQADEPGDQPRKGLGLGLHICKELVTRQGGQIRVEARPRGGSTFSFTLPVFSLDPLEIAS